MDVNDLAISINATIKTALQVIDKTALGTVFVLGKDKKLVGVLTDGDVRRAILNDISLDNEVGVVMNTNYISLPIETDNIEILRHITNAVKIIPLTGAEGELLDYASIHKIRRIAVAAPVLTGNEMAYVADCINTNWISSQGSYVRKFEDFFTEYHEGHTALAVSNGTVALHLALEALRIGEGDEVIVPDLTFAASVNAIIYAKATPVLADVGMDSWNIDIRKAEQLITPKTKAIMPVHLYGNPCNMDAVMELARKYNLLVIEDCAEALGSTYHNRPVGIFGDAATFSFYGNKTITTGEGGMILFKHAAVHERAAMLRDHGMQKTKRYWHAEVGYNYRLTNIQAAIGVAQCERLDEFVEAKRNIARYYNNTLGAFNCFQIPQELEGTRNSYWLYTFMVSPESGFTRDQLIEYLGHHGIETRPVFYPMHIMPPYTGFGRAEALTVSAQLAANGMSLPSSVNLTDVELRHICDMIKQFMEQQSTGKK